MSAKDARDDHASGTWVLVTHGNSMFFGRVHKVDFKEHVDPEWSVEEVVRATTLTFCPVYDFFAPIRPQPLLDESGKPTIENGAPKLVMSREPLIMTRGFALHPFPVHIRNGAGVSFDFFKQMHEDDRRSYRHYIDSARDGARKMRMKMAGLVMPKNANDRE